MTDNNSRKGLTQIFSEKAEKIREKALEVLEDRMRLYDLEIPAEMREGMNRLDHEAKGSYMKSQFNAVTKGGVWGTIVALDVLSYYGTDLHFKKDDKQEPRLG